MTLSDSWDTPPSNPNNRRSSVFSFFSRIIKSCMKNWRLERCVQDGCRDCWLPIESAIEKTFQRSVSRSLIGTRRTFCVDSWLIDDTCRESAPKKAETVLLAGKVMATLFLAPQGIILINYLEKGKTITGTYYASLLDLLKADLQKTPPRLARKKVLFHQDNALADTSAIATVKIR